MSTWNHRVIEFAEMDGTPWRAIHEVHYDDADRPVAYTEGAAIVMGHTQEELRECLERMLTCLDKPVLVERDFEHGSAQAAEQTK